MDMQKRNDKPRFTRARTRRVLGAALVCLALGAGASARAAVFRCASANGVITYADRPCASDENENQGPARAAASSHSEPQLNSAKRSGRRGELQQPAPYG
jgi:uncharacterized protein DUF4124